MYIYIQDLNFSWLFYFLIDKDSLIYQECTQISLSGKISHACYIGSMSILSWLENKLYIKYIM